jgi:16S rRNA (guanine527-N7)-methyltransferase
MTSHWLNRALEESRARGFLGPGPLDTQRRHAEGFAAVWSAYRTNPPDEFLDLGSGGGLPGLVLAETWTSPATHLDSMERRTAFLSEALDWDGAPLRQEVVRARAEEAARDPRYSGRFEAVTARSFGRPAVTAECACRFLRRNGILIVSEPPNSEDLDRWPAEGLAKLGFVALERVVGEFSFQALELIAMPDATYPRGIGIPSRRLLF